MTPIPEVLTRGKNSQSLNADRLFSLWVERRGLVRPWSQEVTFANLTIREPTFTINVSQGVEVPGNLPWYGDALGQSTSLTLTNKREIIRQFGVKMACLTEKRWIEISLIGGNGEEAPTTQVFYGLNRYNEKNFPWFAAGSKQIPHFSSLVTGTLEALMFVDKEGFEQIRKNGLVIGKPEEETLYDICVLTVPGWVFSLGMELPVEETLFSRDCLYPVEAWLFGRGLEELDINTRQKILSRFRPFGFVYQSKAELGCKE